jgi:hypothetical protein
VGCTGKTQSAYSSFAGKIHDFMYGQEENPRVRMINENQANSREKEEIEMANCADMEKGDIFVCKICGLELQVLTPCTCSSAPGKGWEACRVPLKCCDQDMTKK